MTDAAAAESPAKAEQNRKLKLTVGVVSAPFVVATAAWLVLGKMDAAQWLGMVQTLIPIALGIFTAGNVAEKFSPQ